MNSKKIILHIIIRIGILLFLIGSVALYWNFIYDPHALCDQFQHRHTDSAMGIFFLGFFIVVAFYIGLLIEKIYLQARGKEILARANRNFILLSILIAISYIILTNLNH